MKKKSTASACLLALCLAVQAEPPSGRTPRGEGHAPHANRRQSTLQNEKTQTIRSACRRNGLDAQQTDALLEIANRAGTESLPQDCILDKIEEGLAKKVPAEQIAVAAEMRLRHLRTAQKILEEGTKPDEQKKGSPRLLQCTCMALESGLPEVVLTAVVERMDTNRSGRLIPIIEAGETLHLAGLAPEKNQKLLTDFIARELRRHEIQRIVERVRVRLQEQVPFETIRSELWDALQAPPHCGNLLTPCPAEEEKCTPTTGSTPNAKKCDGDVTNRTTEV